MEQLHTNMKSASQNFYYNTGETELIMDWNKLTKMFMKTLEAVLIMNLSCQIFFFIYR